MVIWFGKIRNPKSGTGKESQIPNQKRREMAGLYPVWDFGFQVFHFYFCSDFGI
jgi:hypothetical protein